MTKWQKIYIGEAQTQAVLENALEKQRKLYEERLRQYVTQTQSAQQGSNIPMSMRIEVVGNNVNASGGSNTLYPNLNDERVGVASTSAVINNNTPPHIVQRPRYTPIASTSTGNSSFEFVNNETTRVIPSAPPAPSNEPTKPNRQQPKKNKERNEFSCPTCGNRFGLTIFQCGSGHSSCSDCKAKGGLCGTLNCGKTITDMRNRTLEALIADINLTANTSQSSNGAKKSECLEDCNEVDDMNDKLVETVHAVGAKFCKTRRRRTQKLSDHTLNLMAVRREMKLHSSTDLTAYRHLNRQISKCMRRDLRNFNTARIEEAIERNQGSKKTIPDRYHKVNCPNQQDGCRLRIRSTELENHLQECPFNEMACPLTELFGRCFWRGKINQLDSHFADVHPEHQQAAVDKELIVQSTENDYRIVHLVLIGNFHFLFHIKIDTSEQMLYMSTQLLGTGSSAAKWNYEIHIYNKKQPRRKYQYLDVCLSNGTSIDEIFRTNKCAVLPLAYVTTFENNGAITYKFYIKKRIDE
ncbi:unnamed protein product [Parnassius mnemosyne]|uniref:E3 ubiquitin-protein ligase n=1 Tax=Parnassius mnemosyne TaxID=213953 RepID=A0AAV1L4H3_9NEOP